MKNLILIALTLILSLQPVSTTPIAVTGDLTPSINGIAETSALPSLRSFTASVKNGSANQIVGVYAPSVFAFKVLQQPSSNAGYVSTQPQSITQFQMANQFRTVGLLAHDYLAGANFFNLKQGQEIELVFGNGTVKYYQIYEIQQYQALSPNSPYSNFVDLASKKVISAETLFYRTYGLGNVVVFQTCISTASVPSWGRLFVIAKPITQPAPAISQIVPFIQKAFAGLGQSFQNSMARVSSRVALQ